jgi:hypothetical protein
MTRQQSFRQAAWTRGLALCRERIERAGVPLRRYAGAPGWGSSDKSIALSGGISTLLRDFRRDEFGSQAARPSEGHVQAVNALLATLWGPLVAVVERLDRGFGRRGGAVDRDPGGSGDGADDPALIWSAPPNGSGTSASSCSGSARPRSASGWTPATGSLSTATNTCSCTWAMSAASRRRRRSAARGPDSHRRSVAASHCVASADLLNPFLLVQLPHHRMVNPWTLGAILHEVSHNLQNELRLEQAVPASIARRLRAAGVPDPVVAVGVRWNREIFGDMVGCMLGGEVFVASLMDVIGRTQA